MKKDSGAYFMGARCYKKMSKLPNLRPRAGGGCRRRADRGVWLWVCVLEGGSAGVSPQLFFEFILKPRPQGPQLLAYCGRAHYVRCVVAVTKEVALSQV